MVEPGAVSPQSNYGLRSHPQKSRAWARISAGLGSILIIAACVTVLLTSNDTHESNLAIEESFIRGTNSRAGSPKLFSWVNSFDDGKGTTTAGQHGGTQTISGCDAGVRSPSG